MNRSRNYIKLYNKLIATREIQWKSLNEWTHIHWLPRYTVVDSNKNTSDKIKLGEKETPSNFCK